MTALIDNTPEIYLDEIAMELDVQHGIKVSLPTIQRNLKALGYTSKRVRDFAAHYNSHYLWIFQLSKIAQERSYTRRLAFMRKICRQSAERLVFADETSVNLRNTYRLNGWSGKGRRAFRRERFDRGKRYVCRYLPVMS
jgi:hypothetical protein